MILSLYVNNILLVVNDNNFVIVTKEWLSSKLDMKDIREVNYILGVKIEKDQSKKLLALSQESYIKKIL